MDVLTDAMQFVCEDVLRLLRYWLNQKRTYLCRRLSFNANELSHFIDIYVCMWCNYVDIRFQVKYPLKQLNGKAIKRILGAHLVAPVQARGDHVRAFRVLWRVDDDEGLSRVWSDVVSQRCKCDAFVAQAPSLQMFVSCITGMTKYRSRLTPDSATLPAYPAVSYWAVFDRAESGPDLTRRLRSICPTAVVKQIQSCQMDQENDRLTLFLALKDHCSSFVANKISSHRRHSLLAIETDPHPPNAKLVAMSNSRYLSELPPNHRRTESGRPLHLPGRAHGTLNCANVSLDNDFVC